MLDNRHLYYFCLLKIQVLQLVDLQTYCFERNVLNVVHVSWHHSQDDKQAPVVSDVGDEQTNESWRFQNL